MLILVFGIQLEQCKLLSQNQNLVLLFDHLRSVDDPSCRPTLQELNQSATKMTDFEIWLYDWFQRHRRLTSLHEESAQKLFKDELRLSLVSCAIYEGERV